MNEPGPKEFTRNTVLNFQTPEYHAELCTKFPILMTVLTAATCKGKDWDKAMQV